MGAVTQQPSRWSLLAAGALVVAWIALFFSDKGLLVWYTEPSKGVGMLKCRYFTGTNVVERQFLFTKQGFLGRDTCPRSIDLAP